LNKNEKAHIRRKLTCKFMLWCSVHYLPFMPVSPLALRVPVSTLNQILALSQLNFPTREQYLVVDQTLLVGLDVNNKITCDDIINTGPVAGKRVGAASNEQTRKGNSKHI
jgi:hypothetical protein